MGRLDEGAQPRGIRNVSVGMTRRFLLVSTDPAAGGPSYTSTPIDGPPCWLAGSACINESLYAHDDTGTHRIDTSTLGNVNTIGHLSLEGNAITLTWTHAGQPRSFTLR
jgi:hypothetical protein